MEQSEIQELADEVVDGDGRRAIAACAADPVLAHALSRAAAERLVERASSHISAVDPELFAWPRAQDAVVALAAVPGADASALAGALLRCCLQEPVSGEADKLGVDGLRLILDQHGGVVEQLLQLSNSELHVHTLSPPWPSYAPPNARFLVDAMWLLGGGEGARWMDRLLHHDPHGIVSRRPRGWTPEDWILRFDTLSDRREIPLGAYRLRSALLDPQEPAPREAIPALVRYVCSHFRSEQEVKSSLGVAATVVALHRTGDPEQDAALFWWDASGDDQTAALRWLLELSGAAGTRAALVDAAVARGLVSARSAIELTADLDRPLWADRDVPWVVTEVREEGEAEVPGDLTVLLGATRLPTRTVVAVHPRHGRADAAIELLADIHAEALSWEPAGDGLWVARDGHGRAARAVRDLGVIALDLAAEPPPWFVHDRVPAGPEEAAAWPEAIDAQHLRDLAEGGASLRHQRRALREALRQRGVSEYSSAVVMRHVRDAIALIGTDAPGRSRLGGAARLPAGAVWPALSEEPSWHPAFLAEIALGELPALDPLPPDGTLLVFQETETWSGEHDVLLGTRVFYVPESGALHDPPEPGNVLFPLRQKALRGVAVPVPGEPELVVGALELLDDRDATIAAMNELMEAWWPEHWLLGASLDVQGPSRLELPYWLERASAETRERFAPEELDPERWTLLAQINEDTDAEIMIGDGGSFYLYILKQDLRERRCDRVVGLMQCH